MGRTHKRRTRMVVALSAAVLLAGALVWTSFTASSQAGTPDALLKSGASGGSYELTAKFAQTPHREGQTLVFSVRDRTSWAAVQVRRRGSVPDPFRTGR